MALILILLDTALEKLVPQRQTDGRTLVFLEVLLEKKIFVFKFQMNKQTFTLVRQKIRY